MSLVAVVEGTGDQAGGLPKTTVVAVGMPQDVAMSVLSTSRWSAQGDRRVRRVSPADDGRSHAWGSCAWGRRRKGSGRASVHVDAGVGGKPFGN